MKNQTLVNIEDIEELGDIEDTKVLEWLEHFKVLEVLEVLEDTEVLEDIGCRDVVFNLFLPFLLFVLFVFSSHLFTLLISLHLVIPSAPFFFFNFSQTSFLNNIFFLIFYEFASLLSIPLLYF